MTSRSESRDSIASFFSRAPAHVAVLAIAVVVVAITGLLATLIARRAVESRNWTLHAYDVRHQIGLLDHACSEARASAFSYLLEKNEPERERLKSQAESAMQAVRDLRVLVRDNAHQTARVAELAPLVERQLLQLRACVAVATEGCPALGFPDDFLEQLRANRARIDELTAAMNREEEDLLIGRLKIWNTWFRRSLVAVAVSLALALFLLFYSFYRLNSEVSMRREMERLARQNTESFRSLSGRILQLQDFERRKIARELHDSVGQYLAALRMNLSRLSSERASPGANAQALREILELTDRAISEVRTISHLLHPPLLDELGFESTARWYVEGFSKRSGKTVDLSISGIVERLPREIELALFRVLQESLTNFHRHADAQSVNVVVTCADEEVILEVTDHGKGIAPRILQRFRAGGAAGIGLSGMRERLSELQGTLEVESSPSGTTLRATLPARICESTDHRSVSSFSTA